MRCRLLSLVLFFCLLTPPAWAEDLKPDAFKPLFDKMQKAVSARDRKTFAQMWDVEAVVGAVTQSGFLESIPKTVRASLEAGLAMGIPLALTLQDVIEPFESYELRKLSIGETPGTYTLIARQRDADGLVSKVRWSFVKRGEELRIYDFEDLDLGMSFSTLVASAVAAKLEGAEGLRQAVASLNGARTLMLEGDGEGALRMLFSIEDDVLPKPVEAARQMAIGALETDAGRTKRALAAMRRALELNPDMPIVKYLQAVAYNDLEQHDLALARAKAYVEKLGGDSAVWVEMARAHLGRGDRDSCLAVLARALEFDPQYVESVTWLGIALPTERKTEAVARMKTLKRLETDFEAIAETVKAYGDGGTLRVFTDAFAERYPEHPDGPYYRAESIRLVKGSIEEAAKHYAKAMELAVGRGDGDVFTNAYLDAMLELGKATEALGKAPDKAHALEYMCWDLADGGNAEQLRALATTGGEALSKTHPAVIYFLAEADYIEAGYEAVVKRLAPVIAEWREQDVDESTQELMWEGEDRIVRSLVRLEKFDEAREMAQGIYTQDADGRYLVIVYARAGEIEKAVAALKECLEGGDYDPRAIFEDEDAGTILRENDAFKALREAYYR